MSGDVTARKYNSDKLKHGNMSKRKVIISI